MTERLSRKALYDLVWSEPMKTLSARFGISDVALKKTCARAGIPIPDRGYWAKKDAGKDTFQAAFSTRPPGIDDEVSIGSGGNGSYHYRGPMVYRSSSPLQRTGIFTSVWQNLRYQLVVVQRGERGVPELPLRIMIDSRWSVNQTVPDVAESQPKNAMMTGRLRVARMP